MKFDIDVKNVKGSFDRIADELMNKWFIQVNSSKYRICELEFYYHGFGHKDPYTHGHKHQKTNGMWYVHPSGIDITIGPKKGYGGILIRAIKNMDHEDYIYGPINTLTELFSRLQSVFVSDIRFGIQEDILNSLAGEDILRAPRVNLNPNIDKDYAQRPYRYLIYPKVKHADKTAIAKSLEDQGYKQEYIKKIWG